MISYHLSIYSYVGEYSYEAVSQFRNIQLDNEDDFLRAKQLCDDKKNMAGPWKWSFIPIRTDRLSDLLLPTSIHGALRAKESAFNYSENMLAVVLLITMIWDIVTLPIRLITYLPRLCYNRYVERAEHPLVPYLREKGLNDFVDVEPERRYEIGNGEAHLHIYRKEPQRLNIHLYTQTPINGGQQAEINENLYRLYLAEEEVPFVPTQGQSGGRHALVPGVRVVPPNAAIRLGGFQIPVF